MLVYRAIALLFIQYMLTIIEPDPNLSLGGCPAAAPLSGHGLERQGQVRHDCLLRRRSYGTHGDSGDV